MKGYGFTICRNVCGDRYAADCKGKIGGVRSWLWGCHMSDTEQISDKMAELQKLRVAVVTLLSQENCKLLSRRQRVAGKEIEVMCAERDLIASGDQKAARVALDQLYLEQSSAQAALDETAQETEKLEALLARIGSDIAALCQA